LDAIVLQANEEEGIQVELFGQFTRPPKLISDANQLLIDWTMECGQSLDLAMAFKDTGGCCDGNNLAAAGLPNIDTLGVRGGNIHTDKEFMVIESLVERAQLSYLLLNKLANQGQRLVELAP
jgi:glutamate carboxypeptidase